MLHVLLMELHPGGMAKEMTVTRANELLGRAVIADAVTEHRVAVGREFVADIDRYDQQVKASRKRLRAAVTASGTTLTDVRGVRVVVAAMIIGHVGNIERFTSAAHFASYNATAPIEASSRENKRHRLNKRGNRQLNWAIHTADVFEVPAPNGTTLDSSRLVKGWSIERAATMLEQAGCVNFCINAGGDIALRGRPTADTSWLVRIRHPESTLELATLVTASGPLGVATSATDERGAHIIDPRTHQPTTDLASATVDWIAAHPDYDAYLITHDARRAPGHPVSSATGETPPPESAAVVSLLRCPRLTAIVELADCLDCCVSWR